MTLTGLGPIACDSAPVPIARVSPTSQPAASEASSTANLSDAERFQAIVDYLASPAMDGRGAGTPGLTQARDYLVDRFEQLGLEPAFVNPDGDPDQTTSNEQSTAARRYLQPVQIPLGIRTEQQQLTLSRPPEPGDVDPHVFTPAKDFNALGFSGERPFEGEPVFVGYGITAPEHDYNSYADVAPEALEGKVAIAFRYEPMDQNGRSQWARHQRWSEAAALPNKARWAANHGAAALLVVDPPAQQRASGPLRATAHTGFGNAAPIPVMHITGEAFRRILRAAGREPAEILPAYHDAANQGTGQPDTLAGVTLRGEVDLERPRTTVHNVGGLLPGAGDLKEQVVVVGAHYDHLGFGEVGSLSEVSRERQVVHPGADDNASGTAGLLLLARRMTRHATAHPEADRRTLLFVGFSGEERGLLGSTYLVDHPDELAVPLDQVTAMVNFDMIGRLRRTLYVFGSETGSRWNELVEQARADLRAGPGDELAVQTTGSGVGLSDHTGFYFHDIPVLLLFTGVHRDYHRPTDTAEKVNAEGAVQVLNLAERIVERLVTVPEPMRFTETEVDFDIDLHDLPGGHGDGGGAHGAGAGGSGALLGIMPDYATLEGEQGAGVQAVRRGTPAAAAELEADDLIVGWNGEAVANVRDLTRRLAESEPGQTVRLEVQRDGETQTLEVTLGER